MRHFLIFCTACVMLACHPSVLKRDAALHQELLTVTDSISQLMAEYLYNPGELDETAYLSLDKKIQRLAKKAKSREEFIQVFNHLWSDGPFSHVRLAETQRPAEEMADFIDSMRVGEHSVSLKWEGTTAILTVNSMTGVDTKEGVFEAYREIYKNKADALIIDLRNNTGGTFAGIPLMTHLMTEPVDAGMFVSRKWWVSNSNPPGIEDVRALASWQGWSIKSFWRDVQEQALTRVMFQPTEPHFDGLVYVLTSKKTASAAEFTVDAMAHLDKVTLIGERTAGEMLSQKMFDLPHAFQLSLPIAEYYSTRIGRIEGQGVEPDIAMDPRFAMDLAMALIQGQELNEAVDALQSKLDKLGEEPLGSATVYLLGSMNAWGQDQEGSPRFEYMGEGIYETTASLKKGSYEFKIAPMNWDFDFGAVPKKENLSIGTKATVIKNAGSDNLRIELGEDRDLIFQLDLSEKESPALLILKKGK